MVRQRCVNPFYHRIVLNKWDFPSIILGSIFLAPIRILLAILLFLLTSILSKLCNLFLDRIDRESDPDRYHRWRICCKDTIIHVFRSVLFVCGFYRVKITQKGDLDKERLAPIYILAPHTSFFDILAGVALGTPSSVAKADIVDIPMFGSIFRLSDPVLVERESQNSRADVFKKVNEVIKYSKIVFFPEGTCSNHRGLLQFKTGAFKLGYPVVPVAIKFDQRGGPDTLSWTWDGPSFFASAWLTLCRWRTDMELVKLPVYFPTDEERKKPALYAQNVSKIICKELGIPNLFYSFDDVRFFKYHFFRSSACVKFMKMADKIRQATTTTDAKNGNVGKAPVKVSVPDKKAIMAAEKKMRDTIFTNFLHRLIDDTNSNLNSAGDLGAPLTMELMLKLFNVPEAIQSSISETTTAKEVLTALGMPAGKSHPRLIDLKAVMELCDLRNENLWDRLRICYEIFISNSSRDTNGSGGDTARLSFDELQNLLWLTLSLEDVDQDQEIREIEILSFGDLKNMLLTYYRFALEENAPNILKTEESALGTTATNRNRSGMRIIGSDSSVSTTSTTETTIF